MLSASAKKTSFRLTFASVLVVPLMLTACGGGDESAPAAGAQGGGAPQALPVQVLKAEPTNLPLTIEAVGQTEGVREVEVRARVGGILEKRLYQEGQVVKANQPLFELDRAPFEIALAQAKAALAQQKASQIQAEREAKRLKGLVEQNAISQREYDQATSSADLAAAGVQAAEAQVREAELNLSYTTVRAPMAGVTDRAYQFEGALISATNESSLLTRVFQVNPIRARFSIPYGDLARLPGGQLTSQNVKGAELILPNGQAYEQQGKLDFSSSTIDPQLGTVQFRAEFANDDRQVMPGQFVRVRVLVGEQEGVYLVPQTAVMQSDKGPFVYVVEEGKAAIRSVQAGAWSGDNWVVQSGINAGDQIIVNNLIKVRPGAPVAVASAPPAEQKPTAAANR